jgi:hypothetical protein
MELLDEGLIYFYEASDVGESYTRRMAGRMVSRATTWSGSCPREAEMAHARGSGGRPGL